MKFNAVKIITISGFIILIAAFVLYRAGTFEAPVNIETAALNSMAIDTPKTDTKDSAFVMPDIMPSSKSGIIFKEPIKETKPKIDSTKKNPEN